MSDTIENMAKSKFYSNPKNHEDHIAPWEKQPEKVKEKFRRQARIEQSNE